MFRPILTLSILALLAAPALAASSTGECTVTPKGQKTEPSWRPCWFYQAQGHVMIGYEDEDAFLDLMPAGGVGTFTDLNGKAAYRNKGLGDKGVVFNGEIGTVRFYWGD